MLPVYQNAVNQISDQLWQTDPESAAEQAAVIAENPAQDYYASRGTGTVNAAWSNTTAALHGKKSTGGMPPVDANLTSAGEGPLGIATSIGGFLQSLASGNITGALGSLFSGTAGSLGDFAKQDLERAGLIIFGGLLVLVGVVVLALPAARTAATTAASIERGTGAIGKIGGTGGADPQDAARRQAIADRANSIGERKVALQEQREARLARSQYARQSSP
jgi:hypothetical protein